MRAVLTGINQTVLNKAGLDKLPSGRILSVKIIENNKGLIKASIAGRLIQLKGSVNLKPGNLYRVRTEWIGKTLNLRIIDKSGEILEMFKTGNSENPESLILFEAAKRAGMHLKDENIRLLKRLLRKKTGLTDEKARLVAEAVKKGISPEEMIGIIDGSSVDSRERREKTLLFNHLSSDNELWFIIPYNMTVEGGEELCGSLRLRKSLDNGKINLVVIETRLDDTGRLFFLINWNSGKNTTVRMFSDCRLPNQMKKEVKERLPEILSNLSLKFDDNIIENCFQDESCEGLFDGFSFSGTIAGGVEEMA